MNCVNCRCSYLHEHDSKRNTCEIGGETVKNSLPLRKCGNKLPYYYWLCSSNLSVWCFLMSGQIIFARGLIITLVTQISHSFMSWLLMSYEITLLCSLIFTLVAIISDSPMYVFIVCGDFFSCFIVAKVTIMPYSRMF